MKIIFSTNSGLKHNITQITSEVVAVILQVCVSWFVQSVKSLNMILKIICVLEKVSQFDWVSKLERGLKEKQNDSICSSIFLKVQT